jgi:hypothetical protein
MMFAIDPIVTAVALALAAPPAPPGATTPSEARESATRALPYLKNEGIQWARQRQCHSCHHVGFMVWSLHEARRHGLAVDGEELSLWSDWAVKYAAHQAVYYRAAPATLAALQKAGLPASQLAPLRGLQKTFVTAQDFRKGLAGVLSADDLTRHDELILKTAARPRQGGGGEAGGGTVAAELLLARAPSVTATPKEGGKALVERLLRTQRRDGSWGPAGQFYAFNRPAQESVEVNTAWNVLALSAYAEPSGPAATALARTLLFLKNAKPGVSTESYVVQILLAHQWREADRAKKLLSELLKQQLPDGGWSWRKGQTQGDAFATGEALYALGVLGRDMADPGVRRAWAFLARTQRPDGSWHVPSANLRKDGPKASTEPIFSYWGTGWAVLGILRTLPR